ncbi:hypothetical protein ABFS83_04G160900 [Erythranthe nasuta]
MLTPARNKLMKNLKELQRDPHPPPGISAAPEENNILFWNAVINGPEDTPWSGVYEDGRICLDILEDQWTPGLSRIESILVSIQSLLCDANPDSPVKSEVARLFSENKREYNRRVREIVEQSQDAN